MLTTTQYHSLLFMFITSCLLLAGCVNTIPDKQWQHVCKSGVCTKEELTNFIQTKYCTIDTNNRNAKCPDNIITNTRTMTAFQKSYLEYNAVDGSLRDPQQLKAIKGYIQQKVDSGKNILIAVYIHGWHHNAAPKDSNLIQFDNLLARYVGGLQQLGKKDVEVLGIYVGWQGEIYKGAFNFQTIGNRANVADVIGSRGAAINHHGRGLKQDLTELADTMRKANADNHMIVMGHSLGGRMIARAFLPGLVHNAQTLGDNTLLVTINAAVDSTTFDDAYRPDQLSSQPDYPIWLNLTSKEDTATKVYYPWAHRMGYLAPWGFSNIKTLGHTTERITHQLGVQFCSPDKNTPSQCAPWEKLFSAIQPVWTTAEPYHFSVLTYGAKPRLNKRPPLTQCVLLTRYPLTEQTKAALNNSPLCPGLREDFDTAAQPNPLPARGKMWNIRTDASVIDNETAKRREYPDHNAYIQTDLVTMLLQLVYR
ncbi:hypothetical protein MJO48_02220 [Dickeya fangzhongdai]|uniref:hypothetical protein n=1 Tax=Dickeya fangzhongdai TaxID=1778540 RepID=UPI001EFC0E88|nr:hypothetical protein [Dickeya fangzhongdai]ULR31556.1 hypothetical protein MJO48_02220 [Dickeya fangzhongdai]